MTTKGQCLCGSVKVTVTSRDLSEFPTLCCHCTSCKRRSGGLASYAFVIPAEQVTVTSSSSSNISTSTSNGDRPHGTHKVTTDTDPPSRNPMVRTMCSECGSPVVAIEHSAPGTRRLQYGLFAGRVDLPKPELEMFSRRMCVWETRVGEIVRDWD